MCSEAPSGRPRGQHAARTWWVKAAEQQESPAVPSPCPVGGSALPSAPGAAQGRLHSFLAPLLISAQGRASLVAWHVQGGISVCQCSLLPGPCKLALSIFPEAARTLSVLGFVAPSSRGRPWGRWSLLGWRFLWHQLVQPSRNGDLCGTAWLLAAPVLLLCPSTPGEQQHVLRMEMEVLLSLPEGWGEDASITQE